MALGSVPVNENLLSASSELSPCPPLGSVHTDNTASRAALCTPARARTGGLLISPRQRLLPTVLLTCAPSPSRVEPWAITLCAPPRAPPPPIFAGLLLCLPFLDQGGQLQVPVPETGFLCPSLPEALSWFGGGGDPCRAKANESSLGRGGSGTEASRLLVGEGTAVLRVRGKEGIWLNLRLWGIPVEPWRGVSLGCDF